ncbi:ribonuclease H-like domain-containing protein [Tanacetum coccineum]|uniref:Ribonuclease H-like domain-containing protein n=1 Tax=Tanacetum coccineum TaxID=301880 RepID=A0ABQ5FX21_9ASTR
MSVHNSEHNSPINSNHDDDIHDPDLVTRISKLDISDPLHLRHNGTTALTVVSIKLKGTENYQVWSCAMLLALEGKNKIGFIDGSCKRSNTDEVLGKQWDRVNAVVLGWILNSISEELFYDAMIEFPKCVRNASEGFKKHNQLLKLMQFLMSLDDSYMQIRSSILSREVLPDVRSAYATISSEESHRVAVGSLADVLKIIGYHADFEKKKSGQNFKKQSVSNNNYVGKSSSSGFIDEQMATLISLIKDNKVGKMWANQHMTYTDKELDNILDISHLRIKVGHPNRTEAYISKIGNLRLSNGLTLYDVMVIPEYYVTLISVHKLVKENKVIVAFDENRCYFLNHDLNMKNVLGINDQCEGLYYYNDKVAGDGVTGIKRRRRDLSSDGVWNLATALGRGRLKEDLEWSMWRWRQEYKGTLWNDPRDFAKPVKAIALRQDVPSTSDRRLIELENQVQCLIEAYLAPMQPTQVNKVTTSCEICSGPHDTQYCMEILRQKPLLNMRPRTTTKWEVGSSLLT